MRGLLGKYMAHRKRRPPRRRARSRGFTLIEALVALSVSAMTLGLLASAGFGLQQARQASTQTAGTVDWIIVRRVLHEWAGAAAKSHPQSSGAFEAEADRLSLRTATGEVMRFVIETEDQVSTLTAFRAGPLRDVRMVSETDRPSVLITVDGTLRFSYLMKTGMRGQTRDWTYSVADAEGLPLAIGLELSGARVATAAVAATAAGPCMVGYGMSENGPIECALR